MSESMTPGSSMGMQYDADAMEAGIEAAEHEYNLITGVLSDKGSLYGAFDKYQNEEPLTPQEAGIIAELHSMVAFLHVLQYSESMITPDPQGNMRSWAMSTYRVKDFYRMMEYLRLTGVIRDNVLEANKLVLGIGPVISDVYPLIYQFKVNDIRGIDPSAFQIHSSEDARISFEQLVSKGIISVRHREGKIVGVDNDPFLLSVGNKMIKLLGADIQTHCDNARAYVNTKIQALRGDNIGLILGARIDPLMIGGDSTIKDEWIRRVTKFTNNLVAIAAAARLSEKPGSQSKGQIVLSVGSGKRGKHELSSDYHYWEEYIERIRALNAMKSKLSKSGLLFHQDMTRSPITSPWLQPTLSDMVLMVANAGKRFIQ